MHILEFNFVHFGTDFISKLKKKIPNVPQALFKNAIWTPFGNCWLISYVHYKALISKGIQTRNTLRLKIRIFDLDGLRCFESKNF